MGGKLTEHAEERHEQIRRRVLPTSDQTRHSVKACLSVQLSRY